MPIKTLIKDEIKIQRQSIYSRSCKGHKSPNYKNGKVKIFNRADIATQSILRDLRRLNVYV